MDDIIRQRIARWLADTNHETQARWVAVSPSGPHYPPLYVRRAGLHGRKLHLSRDPVLLTCGTHVARHAFREPLALDKPFSADAVLCTKCFPQSLLSYLAETYPNPEN